jgi:hypothetical protein
VANPCGATKYKHSSLLLARLTSAFFGFLRLSWALFGSLRHGTVETRFLHGVRRHNIFKFSRQLISRRCLIRFGSRNVIGTLCKTKVGPTQFTVTRLHAVRVMACLIQRSTVYSNICMLVQRAYMINGSAKVHALTC